jgi:hypothetical protein
MARFYPALEDRHRDFIAAQKLFFTATAPADGRINLSPKGMDSLRILDPRRVAYLDLTGSGNETAAHLRHDGRMTLMFCSFDAELRRHFPALPGERQLIVLDIDSVQTSCGYAVPLYDYRGGRDTLARWAEKKGPTGLLDYWREKNTVSIDGLPTGLLETP